MKKLLVLVAAFTLVNEASASLESSSIEQNIQNALAEKKTASVANVGMLENAKSQVTVLSKIALNKVETLVKENPKSAIAFTVLATLIAEHVAAFIYNDLVASDDFDDEYEDLDIA